MIILDTNVISEAKQPHPAEAVAHWLRFAPGDQFYTTAVTEAEMRYGAAAAPILSVRPGTSYGIAEFSQHEAD